MSQYFNRVSSNHGAVETLTGWDQALDYFFLVIGVDLDEPYYSNLYEPDGLNLTLEYYQTILDKFEINEISLKPDSELTKALLDDRLNGR